MANFKYFNEGVELTHVTAISNKEFAARFPGVKGRRYDGCGMWVGSVAGVTPFWNGVAWTHEYLPVLRIVEYKSNPSRHECDARCMNATGRIMKCECSCGGKNHGRGFACD